MSSKSKSKAAIGGRGGGAGSSSSGSSSSGHGAGTGNRGRRGNSHATPGQGSVAVKAEVGAGGALGQQSLAASSMADMAHSSGGTGPLTPSKVPLDEDGVSSHADSDAHSSVSQQGADQSMRIARLEQQLFEQAARFEQLALGGSASVVSGQQQQQQQQSQQQQLQQPQQQQPQQQQQQPSQQQVVRVDAVRPPELTYAGATAGTALEDWLFKLEQLFAQTRQSESDWLGRAQLAQLHWDRHMAMWWTGRQETAAAAGTPILSWVAFVAALRKQFVPAGDSQLARTELFKLKMRSGETMESYMQRAVLLVVRAGGLVESKTAAALALEGVDKSRFPFTCAAVARKERAAGAMGMSFAQMREELTVEAATEPQLGGRSSSNGGSNSSSSSSSSGGAKGATNSRQLRINALQQQLKALEEGDEEDADESFGVAPIAGGSDREARDRCSKCGAKGHAAATCRSKGDQRRCHRCKQPGHLIAECQQGKAAQKQGKGDAQGQGAGTAAGTAPGAAGGKPTPKNE
jgi:hypothetical protein